MIHMSVFAKTKTRDRKKNWDNKLTALKVEILKIYMKQKLI